MNAKPRSTMRTHDVMVLIGRFQPVHNGHLDVIAQALEQAERAIILVGSSNLARDTRNPFTYDERAQMIRAAISERFGEEMLTRVVVNALPDSPYDLQEWIETVQTVVKMNTAAYVAPRIALTGHDRDSSSFYLKLFPQWTYAGVGDTTGINATALREDYFAGGVDLFDKSWRENGPVWSHVAPRSTIEFLNTFRGRQEYRRLLDERAAEIAYIEKYGPGPHNTADAVIVQSGHVLVIERGGEYGHGMRALPGGFLEVERKETLFEAAVREAFEETRIFEAVDKGVFGPTWDVKRDGFSTQRRAKLVPHHRGTHTFDEPNRSRRGRIITQAQLFKLPDDFEMPEVIGSDDAIAAYWLPISDIRADEFFEDHAFIVSKMLRLFL